MTDNHPTDPPPPPFESDRPPEKGLKPEPWQLMLAGAAVIVVLGLIVWFWMG